MKYLVAVCASFLCAISIISVVPTIDEVKIYDDVLRFHVIADSDSDEAQALKLAVRDDVLKYVSGLISDCTTIDEACGIVCGGLDEIEATARQCVEKRGYDFDVRAYISKESYPRRIYGSSVMPAGEYTSLRVVIGNGEGHNWWCVLFPTMCRGFAYADDSLPTGFTPQEYRLIRGKGRYKVKLRILEILENVLS